MCVLTVKISAQEIFPTMQKEDCFVLLEGLASSGYLGIPYGVQAGLKLLILLHQPRQCCDYTWMYTTTPNGFANVNIILLM